MEDTNFKDASKKLEADQGLGAEELFKMRVGKHF
jgi:hypothetical protein